MKKAGGHRPSKSRIDYPLQSSNILARKSRFYHFQYYRRHHLKKGWEPGKTFSYINIDVAFVFASNYLNFAHVIIRLIR